MERVISRNLSPGEFDLVICEFLRELDMIPVGGVLWFRLLVKVVFVLFYYFFLGSKAFIYEKKAESFS